MIIPRKSQLLRMAISLILWVLPSRVTHAQYAEKMVISPPSPHVQLKDTHDIRQLLINTYSFIDSHTDSAIALLYLAENRSRQLNYDYGIFLALTYLSNCYVANNNIPAAKELLRQAKHYINTTKNGDKKEMMGKLWYHDMAVIYKYEGRTDSALWSLQRALDLMENIHDSMHYVSIYNMMGSILIDNQDYEKAYPNILKALAMNNGENTQLLTSYINLGYYFARQEAIDSMFHYANQAFHIARSLAYPQYERSASLLLTKYYLSIGEKAKAHDFALNAIRLIASNQSDNYLYVYRILCLMYVEVKDYRTALRYGTIALSSIREEQMGRRDVINIYELLSSAYWGLNKYDSAFFYLRQYYELANQANFLERSKALDQLQQQYEVAQKDKQILQNEVRVRNRNMWILIFGGGVVFLLLTSLSLYIGYNRRIQILRQQKEIDKLRASMQGEEKERVRIARELHDGIGSLLSATAIHLNTFSHTYRESTHDPAFKQTEKLIAEISNEVRRTAHNLMPNILLENNLPEAIRIFCSHIGRKQKLDIKLEFFGIFEELAEEIQLFTYRIIQELMQNIIKHARATEVFVQLDYNEGLLSLTVEDNGAGFDTSEKAEGMGLSNIKSRVESMQGLISLRSSAGQGTSIYIEFNPDKIK